MLQAIVLVMLPEGVGPKLPIACGARCPASPFFLKFVPLVGLYINIEIILLFLIEVILDHVGILTLALLSL